MKEKKPNRTRSVGVRLTPEEYAEIESGWRASTCRKLSEYLRSSLFERPVVTAYRNGSADDFIEEMGRLRMELNRLGNNFNQTVKKLHGIGGLAEFRNWCTLWEREKHSLFDKVEEIKEQIRKFTVAWLQ
ncbi:plasmid mobilization relaxosome protein MobC [Marinilongibacter aquaticus]|uniref:plasmid mobilization protein n=1 Tax=Marinilongibacter aquaticus TaxID=2975157 RepID=UPI0021BDD00B|nr:plasmid mobilization relaxosome protein MobC [Marinilongibacter aquaticus]UBM58814.1 plasmid mobilization relaxosome protein MobC [Marinilongibacter aquaticus]